MTHVTFNRQALYSTTTEKYMRVPMMINVYKNASFISPFQKLWSAKGTGVWWGVGIAARCWRGIYTPPRGQIRSHLKRNNLFTTTIKENDNSACSSNRAFVIVRCGKLRMFVLESERYLFVCLCGGCLFVAVDCETPFTFLKGM
jgi:hypothetical protein